MTQIVRRLQNTVNFIDPNLPSGKQIVKSISIDSVAVANHNTAPSKDTISFFDANGRPTHKIPLDGTIQTQENGGSPTVFLGTTDEFLDKMNNEFFSAPEGDHEFQVSKGQIVGQTRVFVLGRNSDLDSNTVPETIWAGSGLYSGWSIAAQRVRIKAGGSVDDASAGAGAQKVTVFGLDENGVQVEEEIVTAGAAASTPTVTLFKRVLIARVTQAGSAKKNAATVTIEQETSADINAVIPVGANRTQQTIYTVPKGYKLYIHSAQISTTTSTGSDTTFDIFVDFGGTGIFESISPVDANENGGQYEGDLDWICVPEDSDIDFRCTRTTSNNASATSSFHGILVKDV